MEFDYVTLPNGLQLHYLWWEGKAPSVLLVHGLASNAKMYQGVGQTLHKSGLKVVSLDQRGHGKSDKPEAGYDYETLVSDIHEFLILMREKGRLTKKILLVGQSFGCSVVENYALRYPQDVTGLVLIDGGYRSLKLDFPAWDECAAALAPPNFQNQSFKSLSNILTNHLSEFPDSAREGFMANFHEDEEGFANSNLPRHLHMVILHELWKQVPEVIVPKLRVPFVFITALNSNGHSSSIKKSAIAELRRNANVDSAEYWIVGHHDLHAQHPIEVSEIIMQEMTKGAFAKS